MKNPDFRKVLKSDENRYEFVMAVAKRANEVNADDYLRAKCGDENNVSFALQEFVDGKLTMVDESFDQ